MRSQSNMRFLKNIVLLNIALPTVCFLLLNFLLRLLLIYLEVYDVSLLSWPFIILQGTVNDLMALIYYIIPFIIILTAIPLFFYQSKIFKWSLLTVFCFFTTFFILFMSICEFYFWKEFQSRFDFIAVDYLVYTAEVIGNIKETFNLNLIILVTAIISFVFSLILIYLFKQKIEDGDIKPIKKRLLLSFLALLTINFWILPFLKFESKSNRVVTELSKNGLYELFSAFRNNEIDYSKHYLEISNEAMYQVLENELGLKKSKQDKNDVTQLSKKTSSLNPLLKKNIVVILVESLGANFLGHFGNTQGITPYLDDLATKSLSFENLYATGTRTVRGLEAVALSMPPTPGFSILKRPNNENLKGINQVLKKYGYRYDFIYGGYGYFDNMNYFFESNGYGIYDRANIPDDLITFSNIWGVADEDLFNYTLKNIDDNFDKDKPFFKLILTTSNHRPYSYPDNRIDIPSKSGREGAVKYTDFAIGQFIKNAQEKPWFSDTVFIVMADHSADGRGTVSIPFSTYHIPAFIYAPRFIKPQKINVLASQIDVLPSLFDLLGFEYEKTFIGRSLLNIEDNKGKVYLGTYQNVGCLNQENSSFVSLGTKKTVETFDFNPSTKELIKSPMALEKDSEFCEAIYQYSSLIWRHGLMKN
jgi:phosphoglycerol transferase MdoB-like AlkP superfamily enzyme